jgi:hypothetical protein
VTDFDGEPEEPLTPYAGTSGWSGSETSARRAIEADGDGTTRKRQRDALRALRGAMGHGCTWKELAAHTGWHHGTASGTLSVLHKEGAIARLSLARDRCKVYVLPEYVGDRPTEPHGRGRSALDLLLEEWLTRDAQGWSKAGRDPATFVRLLREETGYGATLPADPA